MVNYMELYDNLGDELLRVIQRMHSMEEGVRKKPNDALQRGGNSSGFAAKVELRTNILKEQAKAITDAIKVIKPMAEYEQKIKEAEVKNQELEQLLKEMKQDGDG